MQGDDRSDDWFDQSVNDLDFAENAFQNGYYSQCCFICQQAGEKALKSLLFYRGAELVLTHSLFKLAEQAEINGEVARAAGVLDQYYLSGRYPDALPGGAPFRVFSKEQAQGALDFAQLIIEAVRAERQ